MEKRQSYQQRLKIPIDGSDDIALYTADGLKVSDGFTRVVIGGRGPYVEFSTDQVALENIYIPKDKAYKMKNSQSYYHEYRTKDDCYVKVYFQMIGVQYADYRVGFWYADPELLFLSDNACIMGPLYKDDNKNTNKDAENETGSLFDDFYGE